MRIILKQVKINDIHSKNNGKVCDILIADGIIKKIADKIESDDAQEITATGLQASPGWVDLKANFCEPGNEHKETIETGALAAERGGFTHVCVSPATEPPVDNKAQVEFIKNKSDFSTTRLHPVGCVSVGRAGEELAELYDMYQNGAVFFSDENRHLNSGLLYRAMLYVQNFGGRVVTFAADTTLAKGGMVNEGIASTKTGLKANPAIAEAIAIERNLRLVDYTKGQLHITGLSTAEGVELIRKAKKSGQAITADVHANQLVFNEESVLGFDSNYKVNPPYRREEDRIALWEGIKDGTIDAIVSDHRPAHDDEKEIEFDYASYGNVTLETLFPSLTSCAEFELTSVLRALYQGPRAVMGLQTAKIEENHAADLTLFTLKEHTYIQKEDLFSLSYNSPFLNQELKGRVLGVLNQGRISVAIDNESHA